MNYGILTPNFGPGGDPATLVELAREAELAGWDGFFLWDHVQLFPAMEPHADPWVAFGAIAAQTTTIKLGPLITPLPRRDIVKLARETVTLEHLSGGRLILGIGTGEREGHEFSDFGYQTDHKVRGDMVDEALTVLRALWSGESVDHQGEHYHVVCPPFAPPKSKTPVWVGGYWPSKRPIRRAGTQDGVVPISANYAAGQMLTPSELADILALMREEGGPEKAYDVAMVGMEPVDDLEVIAPYEAVGCNWWVEACAPFAKSLDDMKTQIRRGPPRR